MTKFGRFYIQYKYLPQLGWKRDGNIGDCIQNIAVENIYKKAGLPINDLILVNRDELNTYAGEPIKLVMQSWFANACGVFFSLEQTDFSGVFRISFKQTKRYSSIIFSEKNS